MKKKNDGYLLLECMLAMVIIVSSILFTISMLTFLLKDEKLKQEEVETAIMIYELSAFYRNNGENPQMLKNKAANHEFNIKKWEATDIRVESGDILLEVWRK